MCSGLRKSIGAGKRRSPHEMSRSSRPAADAAINKLVSPFGGDVPQGDDIRVVPLATLTCTATNAHRPDGLSGVRRSVGDNNMG